MEQVQANYNPPSAQTIADADFSPPDPSTVTDDYHKDKLNLPFSQEVPHQDQQGYQRVERPPLADHLAHNEGSNKTAAAKPTRTLSHPDFENAFNSDSTSIPRQIKGGRARVMESKGKRSLDDIEEYMREPVTWGLNLDRKEEKEKTIEQRKTEEEIDELDEESPSMQHEQGHGYDEHKEEGEVQWTVEPFDPTAPVSPQTCSSLSSGGC